MADGLKLKARIIAAGMKSWEVSKLTDIHPSRLSGILNNRIDPTVNEISKIEAVISNTESKRSIGGDVA